MIEKQMWSGRDRSISNNLDVQSNNDASKDYESPIDIVENDIYFYQAVNQKSILSLVKSIRSTENVMITKGLQLGIDPPPIRVHILSGGGTIFAGLAGMDIIKNSRVPIHTYVEGFVASAGTFLSVVGQKRYIYRHSYMLIHQLSNVTWGNYQQLTDDYKNSTELMKKIKEIYKQYTKVPMKEIDQILQHDLYWDAEKCKEYGLVDEIIG